MPEDLVRVTNVTSFFTKPWAPGKKFCQLNLCPGQIVRLTSDLVNATLQNPLTKYSSVALLNFIIVR